MKRERLHTAHDIALAAFEYPLAKTLTRRIILLTALFAFALCPTSASGKEADEPLGETTSASFPFSSEFGTAPNSKYISVSETANITRADLPRTITYTTLIQAGKGETITVTSISYASAAYPEEEMTSLGFDLEKIHEQKLVNNETIRAVYQITYGPQYQNTVTTQTVTIRYVIQGQEDQPRILNERAVVTFGNPPSYSRGCWPVKGRISTIERYSNGSFHSVWKGPSLNVTGTAIDIEAPKGSPILSPFAGTICTMCSYLNPEYGNEVTLTNNEGVDFVFAHLLEFWDHSTKPGMSKTVKKGEIIGYVGMSGEGAGGHTHLHYEDPIQAQTKSEASSGYTRIYSFLPLTPRPYPGLQVDSLSCTDPK